MEQNSRRKEETPNRAFNRDPAEGARDAVEDRDRGGSSTAKGDGITNRSRQEEQEEQDRLPKRGHSQSES